MLLPQTILIFLIITLVLLIIRWLGNHKFKIHPEIQTKITVNTNTILFNAVKSELSTTPTNDSFFVPLGNANKALMARIQLIDVAQETVDLQYYLFHDDDAGRALLTALVEASDRGIKVRLLMDDMDTGGREGNLIRLVKDHPNLSIRIFNPTYIRFFRTLDFLARFPRSSRRMHNKSLTTDTITTVVGGRNIGNEYFEVNTDVGFLDYDVLAAGSIAKDVSKEFNEYWSSGLSFDISILGVASSDKLYYQWLKLLDKPLSVYRNSISKGNNSIVNNLLEKELESYTGTHRVINDPPLKVVSGLFDTGDWLVSSIIEIMSSAKKDLFIVSPYFIPEKTGLELFQMLINKGVTITILTNSFAANDVVVVHSSYMTYRKKLLEMGVRLYELKSNNPNAKHRFQLLGSKRSSLHAKTFLVDKKHSFIGSFNLDPRSAIHNTEMGIVFTNTLYGEQAHKKANRIIKKRAYELFLSKESDINWRENGKIYDTEPETNIVGRILLNMASWLPIGWLL